MCGIVGYVGTQEAAPILLDGLRRLEYRGYDSAGMAVCGPEGLQVCKTRGRLQALADLTEEGRTLTGTLGVGHTRWATHGEPNDINAHPQVSQSGLFAVVHNGIIENYALLRAQLTAKGYTFRSETDTEVVAQLLDYYYAASRDVFEAVNSMLSAVEGAYALGIVCAEAPDRLIAARKDAPLLLGYGDGENFIASDVTALLRHTRDIVYMDDGELAIVTGGGIRIYDERRRPIEKEHHHIDWDVDAAEKGGYDHFMLKEIYEQPDAIARAITGRIRDGRVVLSDLTMTDREIRDIGRICIVACGSSYHVGMVGKYTLERLLRRPVEVCLASEFRYSDPLVGEGDLVIVISQSGETIDTLAALKEAKRLGAQSIAVTNSIGSSIARETDVAIYTLAGPEIAVASTKAYTTQLVSLLMLALYMGQVKESISLELVKKLTAALLELPKQIEEVLTEKEHMSEVADRLIKAEDIFYLGRSIDYAIAMEGALKLKEVSYIHAEAYAAGELKHGTLALISAETPVIAVATQNNVRAKMYSNIQEVRARGADVLGIGYDDDHELEKYTTGIVRIPKVDEFIAPILSVIPMQLLAYYTGIKRGNDVDKPRNLAKSVTVE